MELRVKAGAEWGWVEEDKVRFLFFVRVKTERSGEAIQEKMAAVFISVTSSHLLGDVFINVPLPLINGPMETRSLTCSPPPHPQTHTHTPIQSPCTPPPLLLWFISAAATRRAEDRSVCGVIFRVKVCVCMSIYSTVVSLWSVCNFHKELKIILYLSKGSD